MTTQMAREIAEQPQAARRTLGALLPQRGAVRDLFAGRRHVLLVARGSSDNAAVYGRYLLEAHAGVQASLAAPRVARGRADSRVGRRRVARALRPRRRGGRALPR